MAEEKVYANCNFKSPQAEYIAPLIEGKLRSELNLTASLAYQIQGAGTQRANVGTLVSDAARLMIGSSATQLFTLHFDLIEPRVFGLRVQLSRHGIGAHIGGLLYSIRLNKLVTGEVGLEKPKTFGTSKFTGDAQFSEKLNSNPDLLKIANKFSRTRIGYSGIIVEIPRLFKIVPQEAGAVLIINTLPKMGLNNCLLQTREFLELVARIEAAF